MGTFLTFQGEVAFFQEEYDRAQALYDEAEPLIRESRDRTFLSYLLRRLGQVARCRGDYQSATVRYKESLALSLEIGAGVDTSGSGSVAGSHACLVGLTTLARDQRQMIHASKLLGAVEASLETSPSKLTLADRVDHERIVALVRAQLGEATCAAAWAEGRALTLEQVIAEAEQITGSERRVETSRPPVQATSALELAGLTPREVEVLRLVAQGLTNEQIAEHLVLSRRTVHAHLRSIFSKLDVTTRTAAARVASEYKLV